MLSDATIIEALRGKGFKATPQRIAICRYALNSREHPTVHRIYIAVRKAHPTVSLATVYKTLKVLMGLHLVQELAFTKTETRYDSNMEPHLNVVCLRCGKVTDMGHGIEKMVAKAASAARFTVTGQRLDIYGICESCNNRKPTVA
jgi:Fur family peroxide stress response transcriptional regulator